MGIENILVVDDWEDGITSKSISIQVGCNVDAAKSLKEGIELLNKKNYDAVVLEPATAPGDAAIKAAALTGTAKKKNTPVVVYTALDPNELERYELKENRDFYRLFQKPTSIEGILVPYLKTVAESKSK